MSVRIIIFNVGRGFCTFIKSPNNYSLLIDCAKREKFSPILYVKKNELSDIIQFNDRELAMFLLTHPHDDHLSDIDRLKTELPPGIISGMKNDLEDIKDADVPDEEYENLNTYIDWRPTYSEPVQKYPEWGMEIKYNFGLLNKEAKEISTDSKQWTNNASTPVSIELKGNKIFFPGDLMEEAWEILLERDSFKNALEGTTFFVAAHHGLKSGYNSGIFDVIKPKLNLVSERPGEKIHEVYSDSEYVEGITYDEETRYMISTKTGTIFLELHDNGTYDISQNNLDENIEE